jgi:hypothetical protein
VKKIAFFCIAASALFAGPALAQGLTSQSFIKGGDEVFKLDLGGILNQFDTSVRFDGQGMRGDDINLEGNGLEKSMSSFQAAASWRIASRHRLDLLYFEAKRSGSHTTDREINIDGNVIPVNFSLGAEAKNTFLLGDYRYSFVKTPTVEVAGLLGIYGGQFKYNLTASGTRQGVQYKYEKSSSTTVPLPLVGATVDWYLNPRWTISANLEGMQARVGDVDGSVIVAGVSTDYMLTRNFGLGLAYMYSDVSVDVSKSDFEGALGWKMNSVRAYGQFRF